MKGKLQHRLAERGMVEKQRNVPCGAGSCTCMSHQEGGVFLCVLLVGNSKWGVLKHRT